MWFPNTGADGWAMKVAAADIQLSGLQHFTYRSDGEPAIKALKEAVIRKLRETSGNVEIKLEESGVGESQSAGFIERAIWDIESMSRTLVFQAQEIHGCSFDLRHPIRVFAVEYASQLLNRAHRAVKDNCTSF